VPRASTAAPGPQNDRPETSLYGQGMAFSSADPLKRTPFDTSLLDRSSCRRQPTGRHLESGLSGGCPPAA
jgi:hypothetical protein